jgi:hypothetical protein
VECGDKLGHITKHHTEACIREIKSKSDGSLRAKKKKSKGKKKNIMLSRGLGAQCVVAHRSRHNTAQFFHVLRQRGKNKPPIGPQQIGCRTKNRKNRKLSRKGKLKVTEESTPSKNNP